MKKRSTDDMQTELARADSLKQFLEENSDNFSSPGFPRLLSDLIREKGLSKAEVAKASGMSEVYLHQLISGRRNPSRIRLICLCIGMSLSLEQTQDILRQTGMATLYPRSKWDAIIIYGLTHGMDLFAINDMLYDEDENTII